MKMAAEGSGHKSVALSDSFLDWPRFLTPLDGALHLLSEAKSPAVYVLGQFRTHVMESWERQAWKR